MYTDTVSTPEGMATFEETELIKQGLLTMGFIPMTRSAVNRIVEKYSLTTALSLSKKYRFCWYRKDIQKKDTISLYILVMEKGPEKLRKGFIRGFSLTRNQAGHLFNHSRTKKVLEYIQHECSCLENIPMCPHCGNTMEWIHPNFYSCHNIRQHDGNRIVTIPLKHTTGEAPHAEPKASLKNFFCKKGCVHRNYQSRHTRN